MSDLLELTSSPGSVVLNIEEILAQIAKEYSETIDPIQREALLNLHHTSLNIVQSTVSPEHLQEFLDARSKHYRGLLVSETVDAEGTTSPSELVRVTAREISAGRMNENDELRVLALTFAAAKHEANQSAAMDIKSERHFSLWRRILSAWRR
ncbi:MAG TPA: hypothetical protein VMT94_04515 [Burkholderiales bacterium]|nr:hypothetical protein [Burkholderiales bacterium]